MRSSFVVRPFPPLSLKNSLKRGALVAAANWHVVVVQFVTDTLFKALISVPIVGGVFLAVLLIGGDPSELLALPVGEVVATMASVLLAQPIALGAFVLATALVLGGGSLLMFLVKGGTVTVLVAAERAAGAIEQPPLRLASFHRARQFSLELFTGGAAGLFPRYLELGVGLLAIYLVSTIALLAIVFGSDPGEAWRFVAIAASVVLVAWITVVNLIYLLFQIVIATDDCSVREAARRVGGLLVRGFRTVAAIFAATLGLVVLATAASILAMAALGLIAFVPLIGLAALPLQLVAWIVRGLVFQYIGLSALVAYLHVYRDTGARPAAVVHPPTFTPGSAVGGAGGGSIRGANP